MDNVDELNSKEEKTLAQELDKCAFLYGEEFTKLAEPSRSTAIKFSAENPEENAGRTRIHIDLDEKKEEKLSPMPDNGSKKLTIDKNTKK